MSLRNPLSQAEGLGSAKEGVAHWWAQRLTSVALAPLGLWLAFSLAYLPDLSHPILIDWLAKPVPSVLMLAFVIIACYHMVLGLQVIIEDYIHCPWLKISSLIVTKFGTFLLALAGSTAILKLFL